MSTITVAPPSTGVHVPQSLRAASAAAAGIFLALHGIAHTVAFFAQWELSHFKGISYNTTLFYGKVDVGDVGIRIDGLLWLVAAAAFLVVGLRLAWLRKVEVRPLLVVTLFSLALCVLGLSQAIVGVWIDAAILVGLAVLMILVRRTAAR
jgi:hypothetical protein